MADSRFINETNVLSSQKFPFPLNPVSPQSKTSHFSSPENYYYRSLGKNCGSRELARPHRGQLEPSSLPPLFIACTSAHPLPIPANEKIYGTTRDTEMSKPRCYALIKRSSRKSGARRKRKLRHPAFLRYRRSLSIIIHPVKNRPRRPCFSSTLHSTGLRAIGRGRKNAYLSIEQFLIKRYNIR